MPHYYYYNYYLHLRSIVFFFSAKMKNVLVPQQFVKCDPSMQRIAKCKGSCSHVVLVSSIDDMLVFRGHNSYMVGINWCAHALPHPQKVLFWQTYGFLALHAAMLHRLHVIVHLGVRKMAFYATCSPYALSKCVAHRKTQTIFYASFSDFTTAFSSCSIVEICSLYYYYSEHFLAQPKMNEVCDRSCDGCCHSHITNAY